MSGLKYHIIDLPLGKLSIFVHADMSGTVYWQIEDSEVTLGGKIPNIREWSHIQLSSNTRKVTGVIHTEESEGTEFSKEFRAEGVMNPRVVLRGNAIDSQFYGLIFYTGFLTRSEQDCITQVFPSQCPSGCQ